MSGWKKKKPIPHHSKFPAKAPYPFLEPMTEIWRIIVLYEPRKLPCGKDKQLIHVLSGGSKCRAVQTHPITHGKRIELLCTCYMLKEDTVTLWCATAQLIKHPDHGSQNICNSLLLASDHQDILLYGYSTACQQTIRNFLFTYPYL